MTRNLLFRAKVAATAVFACFVFESNAQNIAITDLDGYTPATSAMLDVYSTTKGMLVPRVALVSTVSPISGTKTQGLLVWNTSTSGTYPQVGFYFWNGSDWEMVGSNNTFSNGITKTGTNVQLGGSLTQNTTITQGSFGMVHNLSGTGDFDVQDAGVSAFFVGDNGNTGIGTNSPAQKLDVAGNVRIGDNIMVEGSSTYKVYRNMVSYSASSATGAFVINTNQPNSGCMFVIKVSGYFYSSTGPYELTVKGYGSGTVFYNTGYYCFGPDNLRVRLGVNASNEIVLIIGDEATNYSYPKFTVTHFYQGYAAIDESYADGWTMGQETSLAAYSGVVDVTKSTTVDLSDYYNKTYIDNLETTLQNNITAEDLWNRSGSYTLLKNSTDKVGIGTSTPSGILHINSTNTNTTGTDGTFLDIQNYSTTVNTMNGLRFNTGSSMYPKGGIFFQNKTTYNRGNLLFATNNTASYSNVTAADADLIINYKGDVGIGIGNADPSSRLTVKGNSSGLVDDPLFEVKNNAGQTVFAVYNEGVRIWVNDDPVVKATGSRGGFAVGGISSSKGETNEFLRVTPDSVRVYVEPEAKSAGSRGGFAVGGISSSKGVSDDYMSITKKNYFIGEKAGNVTTGAYNIFLGTWAGLNNTTGAYNIFMGYYSGLLNTTGSQNTFLGLFSGYQNTTGNNNIFMGVGSGLGSTLGSYNVFIGDYAGATNKSGNYNTYMGYQSGRYAGNVGVAVNKNTFIGYQSGYYSYNGDKNTFIGYKAGYANNGGYSNVYIGDSVGIANTSGNYNTFLGSSVGIANTTGYRNVFIGTFTGIENTTGSHNTYIGYNCGKYGSGGSNNICIGPYSGLYLDEAQSSIYMGYEAARNFKQGTENIFIGYQSGYGTTSTVNGGDYNVFLGSQTGYSLTTGANNVAFGTESGYSMTTGAYNVLIGNYTGRAITTGSHNVALGYKAGYSNTTGTDNVFLGDYAGYYETGSGKLYIDNWSTSSPLIYGDFSNDYLKVNGYMGVNVSPTSTYGLWVDGGTSTTYSLRVYKSAYASGSFVSGSDNRWKKDVVTIDNALNKIIQLRGVYFNWKTDEFPKEGFSKEKQIGFIAQEVESVIPELVSTNDEGFKGMDYAKLTSVLVEAIKEQQKQIEELKAQIGTKDEQINSLRTQVERINQMQEQLDKINELLKVKE
ncbi:MAG: hypothetical protein A2W97_12820 [Bacteroidetes bacterium GWE2_40_63]|nr:MAG: hypothetical protein A2W84_10390 [Bacteroidetes bacterium GWC2_40_13]OFX89613.1 MAG: hypothetical protein A2W97_12820 [Bacteroidetes bacterium GWE2_40_63]OFY24132.1 MAG: hypothetical protein A2W88_14255 [Bacteroidetes bacterium GWF2_40_13]